MSYDKEKTKTIYNDLAPSLQNMIVNMVSSNLIVDLTARVNEIDDRLNDITVTVGPTRPVTVNIDKNINLDTQVNVLEMYNSNGWNRHAVVFK